MRPPPPVAASIDTNVFFLTDSNTGIRFLIDTGACKSLLPRSMVHSGCSTGSDIRLTAANGSFINTYGFKSMQIAFVGRTFQWEFLVADVSYPLIGADFLAHFHLVDVHVDIVGPLPLSEGFRYLFTIWTDRLVGQKPFR